MICYHPACLNDNQPPAGALKAGGGVQPEQWATTKGEDIDKNKEEGLLTLDEDSTSETGGNS
jgi:hypothetical protein